MLQELGLPSPQPFGGGGVKVFRRATHLDPFGCGCYHYPDGNGDVPKPQPGRYIVKTERLPELMDNKMIRTELGITEAAADRIMRQLDTIEPHGLRKLYVRRSDVQQYLDESTRRKAS